MLYYQHMAHPAIYRITCVTNGYAYIGSALDPAGRWSRHQYDLKRNKHHSSIMQNCWNKHGSESFLHEVVELVPEAANLVAAEQVHLDAAFERGRCMNTERVAGSSLGRKHSPETLAKMTGHPVSNETKEKIAAAHRGKRRSQETKDKIARAMVGRVFSQETRAKLAAVPRPPMSAEAKEKISIAHKGRKHSDETKAALSRARKGKPHSAVWRENLSKAHRNWTDQQAYDLVFVQEMTFSQAGKVLQAWRCNVAKAARREKARREDESASQ